MAKESESQSERVSPQKPPRRPVTIDLPAEEVRRAEAEAASAPRASEPSVPAGGAAGPGVKTPEPAQAKNDAAAAGESAAKETEIPSAFATRRGTAGAPPPKWRPIDEPTPSPSRPVGAFLIAGLAGGAIVAVAVIVLVLAGYFQRSGDTEAASEIAALKAEIAKLQLEQPGENLAALQQQVLAVEQSVKELAARPPSAGNDAALSELQGRIATLEQGGATGGSTDALEKRIAELADQVAALRSAQPADAASVEAVLQPLTQQVQELSAGLQEVSAAIQEAPAEERVTAIETKLDDIGKRIDMASALAPAVAADALAAALDSGLPFSNELAAVKSFGVSEADVEALAPQAATGLPTLAQLRATFEAAMESAELAAPIPEETGTFDRLIQSARGLVEVRPVHPTAGSDPAAMVARIRGALAAGDLRTALAEWEALPDTIKAATTDWQKQAEVRLKADDLAASVRTSALSRLGAGE